MHPQENPISDLDPLRRVLVRVKGIVQGVGFRPFIYQLARRHVLGGRVSNQSDGVEIEISGGARQVDAFLADVTSSAPPLARIVAVETRELEYSPLGEFIITTSESSAARSTLISPDVCTCGDCLRELLDNRDRRYRYPFINCTNCGPRYTIIRDIPYDREKTTMAEYVMCPACSREYSDPMNRRFHAQPNACAECGPGVWLANANGERLLAGDEALVEVVRALERGEIVAIKGLGGFHLAVDATNEDAVRRLRANKVREEKPFAVMFSDLDEVKVHCELNLDEEALLSSPQRPVVLLRRRVDSLATPIAPSVAPRNRLLGSFLPYTPLHFLLFDRSSCRSLVMTSGNLSDEPIAMENDEAVSRLRGIADLFLLHNRDIYMRCDDSVTRILDGHQRPIRRSRGYVPVPVFLHRQVPHLLGVGAELKNTICLTRGNEAFLSQHIGDLENLETMHSFEHAISHLERILEIEPECIVHDMHPGYLSTQWALSRDDLPKIAVQHHHAHIAAVIAERGISGPLVGLAMDGTGYGPDGTIWGGEILAVEDDVFKRLGHFRQIALPGGSQAIREPWRVALSCLHAINPGNLEHVWGELVSRWPADKVALILKMMERRLNSPMASSCGRIFDAVSAIAGIRSTVSYEGQAAIELEQAIESDSGSYSWDLQMDSDGLIMDPLPMVAGAARDVIGGVRTGLVSARFHNGMVGLLVESAQRACDDTGLDRVALSGGVFQNSFILTGVEAGLRRIGLKVFVHEDVPSNDACIALGQAWIGAARLSRGG